MKLQMLNESGDVIGVIDLDQICPHLFRVTDDAGIVLGNVKSVKLPKLDATKPKLPIVEIVYISKKLKSI